MTRVLVNGAEGRMGRAVLEVVAGDPDLQVGAALERAGHHALGREVSTGIKLGSDIDAALAASDVVIDFTLPESTLALVEAAASRGVPHVIGTTGFDAAGLARIEAAASRVPIVMAANFSLGVNVLIDLVAAAAKQLADYDLEVLEMHHSRKVDAPSGTALRLAQAAADARGVSLDEEAVYHREGNTGPRETGSIGMQTLRAGDSVGEHTVYLAGPGERIELSHRALSRSNFASGAARAAKWLIGRKSALYSMQDVIKG